MLRIPTAEHQDEFQESRSRFVGIALPFPLPADKDKVLRELEKRFDGNSHVAYAFRCGNEKNIVQGMSDAGEPRGTAGRPIMDVLMGSGITNLFLAVIRYFGGTKLGTGGLVHAYGRAAKIALVGLPTRELIEESEIEIEVQYELLGQVERLLKELNFRQTEISFEEKVRIAGFLAVDKTTEFEREFRGRFWRGIVGSKNPGP